MSVVTKKDVKKENMILTLILWGILTCGCMASMLYVASRKTIVIADTIRDESSLPEDTLDVGRQELLLQENYDKEACIRIPIEKGSKAENVVMENRYMERELWIYLKDAKAEFYEKNAIHGNLASVQNGYCERNSDGVVLKLCMKDILEYRSTMEENSLVIAYYEPEKLYEQIVVVDPMGGGMEKGASTDTASEKEITLQVARQLQKKWEQEKIKLYFTRVEDVFVSLQERLELVEAVDADIYIGIGACADAEHSERYGIHSFYNAEYFIPEFGNIQLADVLTRNVTVAASNRAIGLTSAADESILSDIEIPAAEICVGYLSNEKECALLQQQHYQEKLAEGLANAILEVYTDTDWNDEEGNS